MSIEDDPFAIHIRMLGFRKKTGRTRQFDVHRVLQEFQAQNQYLEFNPNHDERGRFASGDGGGGGGNTGGPLKSSPGAKSKEPSSGSGTKKSNANANGSKSKDATGDKAKQALIKSKLDSAVNLHGKPVTLSDEHKEAISKALNTLPRKHLENINRVMVHDGATIPLSGNEAYGAYIPSITPMGEILDANEEHGYGLERKDLALATGRTPEDVYSTAVHEAAHAKWDNMQHFGSEEDKQKVENFSQERDNLFHSESGYDNRLAFADAYGPYGTPDPQARNIDSDRQETFTTISQAYYGAPRRTATLPQRLGRKISGEEYLSEVEKQYPQMKGLHDAFRKMINTGK